VKKRGGLGKNSSLFSSTDLTFFSLSLSLSLCSHHKVNTKHVESIKEQTDPTMTSESETKVEEKKNGEERCCAFRVACVQFEPAHGNIF
jgi:hypothetical protein